MIDRRFRLVCYATALTVVYYALLAWAPFDSAAADPTAQTAATIALGFVLATTTYAVCLVSTTPRTMSYDQPLQGFALLGIIGFLAYVTLQTSFHSDHFVEIARTIVTVTMMLSAVFVGRFLALHNKVFDFWKFLGSVLAVVYTIGLMIAVVRPYSVWWSDGILGGSFARGWFFWILVPHPLVAFLAFFIARRNSDGWVRKYYSGALMVLLVLVLLTRTRLYIVPVVAFLAFLHFSNHRSTRLFFTCIVGLSALLLLPGVIDSVARWTRLSSLFTGVDPITSSTDISNGRAELASTLGDLFRDNIGGVGAQNVRESIVGLDATTELGLPFFFAAYGVATLLLVFYLGAAAARSTFYVVTNGSSDWLPIYAASMLIVVFSPLQLFGSASSPNDWLALVTVTSALFGGPGQPLTPSATAGTTALPIDRTTSRAALDRPPHVRHPD